MGGKGVKEYPSMPIAAATALAIAVTETNNPRNAIKALGRGTRAIIIRLKPNEFLSRLAKPITRSTNE